MKEDIREISIGASWNLYYFHITLVHGETVGAQGNTRYITAGGKRIAILDDETAAELGVHSGNRVSVVHGQNAIIAIANITEYIPNSRIGLYEEISQGLGFQQEVFKTNHSLWKDRRRKVQLNHRLLVKA